MATLNDNIAQVKADFKAIKGELVNKGASIPSGTPTSQYANIIKNMSTGGSEEAYEQGRQDVIAESKYIPKSAIGKFINLTDVSEVSHKVKVVGVGNEVDVYGKNLFDISASTEFTKQTDGSYAINVSKSGKRTPLVLPYGTYTLSYELKCPVGKNARIRIDFKDGTYTEHYQSSTGEFLCFEKVVTGEIASWHIECSSHSAIGTLIVKNATLNVGSIAESYEPYTHQTITATPMGTEVSSMCPNMNFFADEDIQVNYYSSFGMNEQWSRFWDSYQYNGTRTDYGQAFSGRGWNDRTFKPKYDIKPSGSAGNMFISTWITDLVKLLDDCGIVFDTSLVTSMQYAFQGAKLTRLPKIDLSSTASATNVFNSCSQLLSISELVCTNKNIFSSGSFQNCTSLVRCIFSGIVANDLNTQWCPWDDESLMSLSVALCDLALGGFGDGWGSRTLTLSAESIARLKELTYPPDDLNPEGAPYAEDGASCYNVIVGRKGWNIA